MAKHTNHSEPFAVPVMAPALLLDARARRQIDAVCRIGTAAGWRSAGQAVGDLLAELDPTLAPVGEPTDWPVAA
jgi:hypothetical protein